MGKLGKQTTEKKNKNFNKNKELEIELVKLKNGDYPLKLANEIQELNKMEVYDMNFEKLNRDITGLQWCV